MGPIIKSEIISQNKSNQGIEDNFKSGVGIILFVLWHGIECLNAGDH